MLWRRVVASPKPKAILELDIIRDLVAAGTVVIACGGGGLPVFVDDNDNFKGVEAVVDKDYASSLVAQGLGADLLLISTAVEKVAIHFNKPEQQWLENRPGGLETGDDDDERRQRQQGAARSPAAGASLRHAIKVARPRRARVPVAAMRPRLFMSPASTSVLPPGAAARSSTSCSGCTSSTRAASTLEGLMG